MAEWIRRINLLWVFIILLAFHGLMYYAMENDDWLSLTLIASLVDTVILAGIKYVAMGMRKQKRR
ncbi:hypothetical protein [Paenibacillus xerothermodurans]|uniref:Uncharacterized protein n=1 Tax=Paenibacillus xerothermodurans TaxID=1977292 RepID=A0A2W1NDN9_PAEXE|nr:hypothetical protein [Paenibacillus xerothermodurans]PZE21231.1 hypothetical protein CBW46_007610 [Paenibacillus xerothermodurans]